MSVVSMVPPRKKAKVTKSTSTAFDTDTLPIRGDLPLDQASLVRFYEAFANVIQRRRRYFLLNTKNNGKMIAKEVKRCITKEMVRLAACLVVHYRFCLPFREGKHLAFERPTTLASIDTIWHKTNREKALKLLEKMNEKVTFFKIGETPQTFATMFQFGCIHQHYQLKF